MRSVSNRFKDIEKKNPGLSSLMVFAGAVRKQNYSKKTIQTWFNKLVDKKDYKTYAKKTMLEHCFSLSDTDKVEKEAEESPTAG
jgi:hypothetical protein